MEMEGLRAEAYLTCNTTRDRERQELRGAQAEKGKCRGQAKGGERKQLCFGVRRSIGAACPSSYWPISCGLGCWVRHVIQSARRLGEEGGVRGIEVLGVGVVFFYPDKKFYLFLTI